MTAETAATWAANRIAGMMANHPRAQYMRLTRNEAVALSATVLDQAAVIDRLTAELAKYREMFDLARTSRPVRPRESSPKSHSTGHPERFS